MRSGQRGERLLRLFTSLDKSFLDREVPVERRTSHACPVDEAIYASSVDALAVEEATRRLKQTFTRL
jgi:hypothetical protein